MNIYKRHRFPPDVISYAVWLCHRFNLSHRDIEDLPAERGITVSHESIRLWCIKFGTQFARRLRRKHAGFGDTFYIDEVFVRIGVSCSICGVPWTRTEMWSKFFFRTGGTPGPRSGFSVGWSGVMDPNPGKSSPTSWAVIGLPIGN